MGESLGSLGDFLGGKLNDLKNSLKTSIDNVGNTIGFIWQFFSNFFIALKDFLVELFVPSGDFWFEKTSDLYDIFITKFPWVETMRNMFGVGFGDNKLSIGFLYGTTINFDWYLPYQTFIKGIMATFFGLLGLFYIISRLRVQFTNTP